MVLLLVAMSSLLFAETTAQTEKPEKSEKESRITPDELAKKNKKTKTLVDTLSVKGGYSFGFTTRTDDKGGVANVNDPEHHGAAISARLVFNAGKQPFLKPYIDFTTFIRTDRVIYLPSIGIRHDFGNKKIEPYISLGVGLSIMDRSEAPVSGAAALDDKTYSANLTIETGIDFYLAHNFALSLSARYDIYNLGTTIGGYYQLTTIEDRSSISAFAGIVIRFGKDHTKKDDDDDGIFNNTDYCINTPPNAPVDDFGCAKDDDFDGVINLTDSCPSTIPGAPVDEKGCALDSDNDGVIDLYDRCPETLKGTPVTECGCYPSLFTFSLNYEFNKYKIEDLLNNPTFSVVEFLKKNKNYNIRITGHVDDVGSIENNKIVAKRRATSAAQFLIDNQIEASRIETQHTASAKSASEIEQKEITNSETEPQPEKKAETEDAKTEKIEEVRSQERSIFIELFRTDKKMVK
ncbi:OmpA family protein [bacterium]|nr:OmpA family protein [bacterium]